MTRLEKAKELRPDIPEFVDTYCPNYFDEMALVTCNKEHNCKKCWNEHYSDPNIIEGCKAKFSGEHSEWSDRYCTGDCENCKPYEEGEKK